jgi:hypothetical protein
MFVPIASGLALLAVLAASPALAEDAKPFTGIKDCNTQPGVPNPGGYCTYTQSNLEELHNAKAYYTNPVIDEVAGVLTSPITLIAVDGSTATGKCTFYFATVTGHCEYWSGTGELEGFHANIEVAGVTAGVDTNVYTLTGTYWFDDDED